MTNKEGKEAITAKDIYREHWREWIRKSYGDEVANTAKFDLNEHSWIESAMEEYALLKVAEERKKFINRQDELSQLALLQSKSIGGYMNDMQEMGKRIRELESEVAESRKANVINDVDIFKWLKSKNYQTSSGEQEYQMYFDLDMPKIIKAAIEHFSGEIVPTEKEWISVKERLPEVDELVQVWRIGRGWTIAKRRDVGGTTLWHFDTDTVYTYEAPSHWMPRPSAPDTSKLK